MSPHQGFITNHSAVQSTRTASYQSAWSWLPHNCTNTRLYTADVLSNTLTEEESAEVHCIHNELSTCAIFPPNNYSTGSSTSSVYVAINQLMVTSRGLQDLLHSGEESLQGRGPEGQSLKGRSPQGQSLKGRGPQGQSLKGWGPEGQGLKANTVLGFASQPASHATL